MIHRSFPSPFFPPRPSLRSFSLSFLFFAHQTPFPLSASSPLRFTEPSGGAGGHASDFEITAKEILRMRAALTDIYRVHCSFPGETPEQARDRFGELFFFSTFLFNLPPLGQVEERS